MVVRCARAPWTAAASCGTGCSDRSRSYCPTLRLLPSYRPTFLPGHTPRGHRRAAAPERLLRGRRVRAGAGPAVASGGHGAARQLDGPARPPRHPEPAADTLGHARSASPSPAWPSARWPRTRWVRTCRRGWDGLPLGLDVGRATGHRRHGGAGGGDLLPRGVRRAGAARRGAAPPRRDGRLAHPAAARVRVAHGARSPGCSTGRPQIALRLLGQGAGRAEENVHSPEELRILVEQSQEGRRAAAAGRPPHRGRIRVL